MPTISLRARLALLVLLALLPAVALLVILRSTLSQEEIEESDARVRVVAQMVAETQAAREEGARQMLLGITEAVAQIDPASPACEALLRDLGSDTASTFINVGILDLDGSTVCASRTNTGRNVDVSARPFFRRALETQQFTVGERLQGANSGRALVNYLEPIFDGDAALTGFAILSLNLDRLQTSLASVPLPVDAAVALLDRTGAVLAKVPSDAWIGDALDPARMTEAREANQSLAVFDGEDGIERHFAFAWVGGRRDMVAVAAVRDDIALGEVDRLSLTALVLLLAWGGGVLAFVFFVADQQLRQPLEALLVAARRLGSGDLGARAEVGRSSLGLDELGRAFNRMADALADREQHGKEAQRLEAIGQIAGGLAHDFNNLMTVIIGFGHSLEKDVTTEEDRENVRQVLAAAERASALTRELMAFARRQELQPQPLQLSSAIEAIKPMLERVVGVGVSMVCVLDPALGTVRADPARIEQMLLNFVLNARDAMPAGGRITVETRNVALGAEEAARMRPVGNARVVPGEYVVLEVSDTGEGISPELRNRIFEPFFTTKGARGTGLGLATAYGIVGQSGGYLYCDSVQGEGTTFTVLLPRVEELASADAPPDTSGVRASGSETVLIVEDEPSVRVLADRVLRGAGYQTATADSAAAALATLRSGRRPHLVLTDVMMPHMNGIALAESLRTALPGVRVLYMSGHVEHEIIRAAKITPAAFLRKPFTPDALLLAVRRVLDAPAAGA